jgi:hypothetical protein
MANYEKQSNKRIKVSSPSTGIYFLAFVGALVYFIQHAVTFWAGVVGFFKAIFWPAVIMYKLLEYFKI